MPASSLASGTSQYKLSVSTTKSSWRHIDESSRGLTRLACSLPASLASLPPIDKSQFGLEKGRRRSRVSLPQSTILHVRQKVEANCDSNPATKFQKNLEKRTRRSLACERAPSWAFRSEPGAWAFRWAVGADCPHQCLTPSRAEAPKVNPLRAVPLELERRLMGEVSN